MRRHWRGLAPVPGPGNLKGTTRAKCQAVRLNFKQLFENQTEDPGQAESAPNG